MRLRKYSGNVIFLSADILNPITMSDITKNIVPMYLDTSVGNNRINPNVNM